MRNPQIQEVLSALGVQMSELAKWLGWSVETIVEYATTSKDVPEDALKAMAGELDIDVSAFFDDKWQMLAGQEK